ncbi:orexin receptor type 2 [Patella vulgata]|uniref:orexin receptor type 2 n=1 Tax=Patella vulgata TaxID=6465 RepID=UPI00217FE1F3|nr:orexin receptor type 2 [Patella vulgata]XP_050397487.1 orexin receptor type 2 [Patella vulgata]XP_050397488.1 orexin receptor type 2 [Patella vulgata]XP_050397489.1 orexin receptor type 2 [Patella vulgata]
MNVVTTNSEMEIIDYLISINDTDAILIYLNDNKARLYIPVIVFLIFLSVVGTFGNILVCCVYWKKAYKASSHYFILTLAILDLVTCLIGVPTEIFDLRYPYVFFFPIVCKILRFIHSSTIISSSSVLIAVAFDRYYRICRLGKQFSVRKARILCIVSVILGILTSWPSVLLFGQKTIELGIPGVYGADCSTDDSVRGTIYPTLYYGFLFNLFFMTVVFFAILYTKIGLEIWRRKKAHISDNFGNSETVKNSITNTVSDPTSTEMSSDVDDNCHIGKHVKVKIQKPRQRMRVGRTTTVLFAVTLAYILSFLPYLIVMVLRSVLKDFESGLDDIGEVIYKFCVKSFFINNAINPIIYSFLNASFRKDAKQLLRRTAQACYCCRRSEH